MSCRKNSSPRQLDWSSPIQAARLTSSCCFPPLLNILFFNFQLYFFALDIEPQPVVNTHINVRNPHQRENSQKVTSPIRIQQFESCEDEEEKRDIVAETIFASEEIKEFSLQNAVSIFTSPLAILAWLTEDLFMRDRPCDRSDGNRQNKE